MFIGPKHASLARAVPKPGVLRQKRKRKREKEKKKKRKRKRKRKTKGFFPVSYRRLALWAAAQKLEGKEEARTRHQVSLQLTR